MKATSMGSSPASIARARPPCVVIRTGAASRPCDTASATGPDMYAVVNRVTTPLRRCSTIGAWTGKIELAATVKSRRPAARCDGEHLVEHLVAVAKVMMKRQRGPVADAARLECGVQIAQQLLAPAGRGTDPRRAARHDRWRRLDPIELPAPDHSRR
jgi:hypothetical protein